MVNPDLGHPRTGLLRCDQSAEWKSLVNTLSIQISPSPSSASVTTQLQLVDSMFSSCYSQMIVNQSIGPLFSRSVGLFQGSILSPWLFNVYIDDLTESLARIDPHPVLPPLLLFADDIKLQPSTPNIAAQMLSIVQTWSIHNGININVNKSAVIDTPLTRSLNLSLNSAPSLSPLLTRTLVCHTLPVASTFPPLSLR